MRRANWSLTACIALMVSAVATTASAAYQDVVKANPYLEYYWTFDESGDKADAIEQANNGSALKILDSTDNDATRTASLEGLGRAASLDGDGDCFRTDGPLSSTSNSSNNWAIEFWMRDTGTGSQDQSYLVHFNHNAACVIHEFNANLLETFGSFVERKSIATTSVNTWHHVVVASHNSANYCFYLDGEEVSTGTWNAGSLPLMDNGDSGNTTYLGFGAADYGSDNKHSNSFEGQLDELAIYDFGTSIGDADFNDAVADIAGHVSAVPEPSSLLLTVFSIAFAMGAWFRRRRSQ